VVVSTRCAARNVLAKLRRGMLPERRPSERVPVAMLEALRAVTLAPLPERLVATMGPASKPPLLLRSTRVLGALMVVPLVRELLMVPAVMLPALV
jgi:hypothetical protein